MGRYNSRFFLLVFPFILGLSIQEKALASLDNLLECTSQIIYSRKGGYGVLQDLANMVEDVLHTDDQFLINNHLSMCHLQEKTLKHASAASSPTYIAQISALTTSDSIKKMFLGFASPKTHCEVIGGHFGATFYMLGINTVFDLAFCESTLGNRWLELRPGGEVAFGPGLGINAGFQAGWDSDQNYSNYNIGITPRVSFNIASLIGFQVASRGLKHVNTFGIDFALGGKVNIGIGGQMNFTAFPLGNNFSKITMGLVEHSH